MQINKLLERLSSYKDKNYDVKFRSERVPKDYTYADKIKAVDYLIVDDKMQTITLCYDDGCL